MSTTCPHCGALSQDPDWCDVCGGDLREVDQTRLEWLEVGDALSFSIEDRPRMCRVVDLLEAYSARRVLLARLCPLDLEEEYFSAQERGLDEDAPAQDPDDPQTREHPAFEDSWPLLLIEESEEDNSLEPDVLTEDIRDLVQLPLAQVERGSDRRADVFMAPAGKPLQEFLESQNRLLSLEEAAKLTHLLLDAIERIHNAGLYHFQICPWTIRVSPRDAEEGGELSLDRDLDMLALSFESIRGFYDASKPLESHPVILGFSPPEFFRRSSGPLDHRADLFGAGMLFYYLLAGTPPPTGALTRHCPHLPVRGFRFKMMPGLQAFVDGCTALNPADRFSSVAQARAALNACIEIEKSRRIGDMHETRPVSVFGAVDRHIGIGKGRRTPVNQDGVFMGQAPHRDMALIAVGDGVSTASYGSGDVASRLLVEAAAEAWREVLRKPDLLRPTSPPLQIDDIDEEEPEEAVAQPAEQSVVVQEQPEQVTDPEVPAALIEKIARSQDESLDEGAHSLDQAPADEAAADEPAMAEAQADQAAADEVQADADEAAAPMDAAEEGAQEVEALAPVDGPAPELELDSLDETFGEEDEGSLDDEEIPMGRLSLVGHRTGPMVMDTPAAHLLRRVLETSNSAISAYINERFAPFDGPVHEVMGTTALLAAIYHDMVTIASLGDSRAYLLRNGHMECLTRDHNLATMRILEGFSADECLSLPQGMALARCLGTFEIRRGTLRAVHPEPDLMSFRMLPGDVLLLTTDGLIDFAGPTEAAAERNIKAVLEAEEIPALAALRLILMANEGGGEDNIGLAILRVTERQPSQRPMVYQAFPPVRGMSPGE